eukprot:Partr_v1_DN26043_c1_g1_i6_m214 putative capping protein (actin filament) muscle Z-line, alpha
MESAINSYVAAFYPNGAAAVYENDGTIYMLIASNKYNSANFWNGRWRSEWKFNPLNATLSGKVQLNVHYYEDGNVQLESVLEETSQISATGPDAIAEEIKTFIAEKEKLYQTSLNESYAQLSENTFKGLRRALPVTKSKLDWNKVLVPT